MPAWTTTQPLYVPTRDTALVIQLPGERVRGVVKAVPDDDTAIVQLVVPPMLSGKSHRYRNKDLVPVRRQRTPLEEVWVAVDEHQLALADAMKRLRETSPPAPPPVKPSAVKETPPDATRARPQSGRDFAKHPGASRRGAPAGASRGRVAEQRAAKSKPKSAKPKPKIKSTKPAKRGSRGR